MNLCDQCELKKYNLSECAPFDKQTCDDFNFINKKTPDSNMLSHAINELPTKKSDPVNSPTHYVGKIECIDYLRDKLTPAEFTGFCIGNVLKYCSRWRKKDGVQDLHKAKVYLEWAIENEEKKP